MLLAERSRSVSKASTATRKDDRRERAEARAALAPLRRKAQDAEKRIAALAAERAKIETKLADPALYVSGRTAEITAANARLAAIAKEAQAAEEEWLMAAEELELAGY
jgi:ATP-binding cassette, subfamily F, member 3